MQATLADDGVEQQPGVKIEREIEMAPGLVS